VLLVRTVPSVLWFGFLTYNSIVVVRFLDGTAASGAGLGVVAVGGALGVVAVVLADRYADLAADG
jgi:hypothetical protein